MATAVEQETGIDAETSLLKKQIRFAKHWMQSEGGEITTDRKRDIWKQKLRQIWDCECKLAVIEGTAEPAFPEALRSEADAAGDLIEQIYRRIDTLEEGLTKVLMLLEGGDKGTKRVKRGAASAG